MTRGPNYYKWWVFQHLTREHGNLNCYRCGMEIASPFELSLEHKIAKSVDPSLEFDYDNISWSHYICNAAHSGEMNRESGHMARVGSSGVGNCYRWNIQRGLSCTCGSHAPLVSVD
jgi:hypothetical protein